MHEDAIEDEKYIVECSNCFIIEWKEKKDINRQAMICDFCRDHPLCQIPNSLEQVQRMLDVLHDSRASRFPNVIRSMFNYLNNKG